MTVGLKNRVPGLPSADNYVILCAWYRFVTDGQTDGHIDTYA